MCWTAGRFDTAQSSQGRFFLENLRKTNRHFQPRKHGRPRNHKLHAKFGHIMKNRTWPALTEPALVRSSAAWSWLRYYSAEKLQDSMIRIKAGFIQTSFGVLEMVSVCFLMFFLTPVPEAGQLNLLCFTGLVINRVDDAAGRYYLILNQHQWSTLVWPLKVIDNIDVHPRWTWRYCFNPDLQVQWLCVFDPEYYEVQPTKAWWCDEQGLVLVQTGDPQPLVKYVLLEKTKELTNKSLQLIAEGMGIEKPQKMTRTSLLQILAGQQGNSFYVDSVLERDSKDKPQKQKNPDEFADFVDALFGQMDSDERVDFLGLQKTKDEDSPVQKRKQWNKWLKEKLAEKQAGSLVLAVLLWATISMNKCSMHNIGRKHI